MEMGGVADFVRRLVSTLNSADSSEEAIGFVLGELGAGVALTATALYVMDSERHRAHRCGCWFEGGAIFLPEVLETRPEPLAGVVQRAEVVTFVWGEREPRLGTLFPVRSSGRATGVLLVVARGEGVVEGSLRLQILASLDVLALCLQMKCLEERARGAERGAERLTDLTSDLVVLCDATGGILRVNPSTSRAIGESQRAFLGQSALEWLHPEEQATLREGFVKALHGVGPLLRDFRLRTAQGYRSFRCAGIGLDPPLGAARLAVVMQEIHAPEQRVAERQRREVAVVRGYARASLSALAGRVAHDFNNLLSGILGNVEIALDDLAPEHPVVATLETLFGLAQQGAASCRELMAQSRLGTVQRRVVDINVLVSELVDMLRDGVRCELRMKLGESLPPVEADADGLSQVVWAVLENAIEAVDAQSGRVEVQTRTRFLDQGVLSQALLGADAGVGHFVSVSIGDNGAGVTALRDLFKPFYSTRGPGRGFGLSLLPGVLRAHGGVLLVRSAPGQGAVFELLWPLRERSEAQKPVAVKPAGLRKVVLLVDDDEAICRVWPRILANHGYEVLSAGGGGEAMALLEASGEDVSLVLLDLSLPESDGDVVFRQINAHHPHLPVVLMSGYSPQEMRRRVDSPMVVGTLQKPFKTTELLKVLEEVL